ncbi:MAG: hypothetical protein Q8P88_03060 [Candidatus Jorgensenbacteria bacterium]|nr:hypothetical protein [Candidatus Jorgensenbacteria bacterium]
METLKMKTDARKGVLKNAMRRVILEEHRQLLTPGELFAQLLREELGFEYNRAIVENLVGELEREGQVRRADGMVLWAHRRQLCHQDDDTGHCKCCGTTMPMELGDRRCTHC